MKYSDDLYDVNHDIKLASVFGILCAIASAAATVGDVGAATQCQIAHEAAHVLGIESRHGGAVGAAFHREYAARI